MLPSYDDATTAAAAFPDDLLRDFSPFRDLSFPVNGYS
jgi:hypothetical protein